MADRRRVVSAALFAALGLAGAFVVSAVAGYWDDEPAGTGLRVFGPAPDRPQEVRIEVLNGAGTPGIARDATHRLRGAGFDVVFFGNADHFGHEASVVIDRLGAIDRARAVAAALEIDSVVTAVDSSLMLEVTVVLGDDWPPPPPDRRGWLERLRDAVRPDGAGAEAEPGGG